MSRLCSTRLCSALILSSTLLSESVSAQVINPTSGRCEPPNVMILLDRSGSMLDDDKWGQAQRALEESLLPAQGQVQLGVLTFPWGDACGVPPEAVRVPVGELSATSLAQLFSEDVPVDTALTPLAGAIDQGRQALNRLADQTRRGVLVLLTDGVETCADGGDPSSEAPFFAAQEAVADGYSLYTIGFGSLVRRSTLRTLAEVGGSGRELSAADGAELSAALEGLIAQSTGELCDLIDNDCDGRVDEEIEPQACEGACGAGERRCVEGVWSECVSPSAPEERCDGADNDCDGLIDENLTFQCELNGVEGAILCDEDVSLGERAMSCLPLPMSADDPNRTPEGCDGLDNDADGRVDEGTELRCSRSCHEGRRVCLDGEMIGCSAPEVGEERCNAYDDDCDGRVDEVEAGASLCPGEERCGVEGVCLPPCNPQGGCAEGFVCGADGYCASAPCSPTCTEGALCVAGRCVRPCAVNIDCPQGERCEARRCVPGEHAGTREPFEGGSTTPEPPREPAPTPEPEFTPPPSELGPEAGQSEGEEGEEGDALSPQAEGGSAGCAQLSSSLSSAQPSSTPSSPLLFLSTLMAVLAALRGLITRDAHS